MLLLLLALALLGVVENIDQLGLVDSVHHGNTAVELDNGDVEHILLRGLLTRRIDVDLIEVEGDLCCWKGIDGRKRREEKEFFLCVCKHEGRLTKEGKNSIRAKGLHHLISLLLSPLSHADTHK